MPIVHEPVLTRTIYWACDLGQVIPADLYEAVAQLLAFVFGLRAKGRAHGYHELPKAGPRCESTAGSPDQRPICTAGAGEASSRGRGGRSVPGSGPTPPDTGATDGAREGAEETVISNRIGQIAIPAAIVGIVVMMVVPLPTPLIDLLLVSNIALATLALLVSMSTRRVLDFSIFPSYLLIATLFRLALNVSVTRLVLLHGYAGQVIESFGHFVVGGSVIVGLVIFLILIVIQFIVITNGAGRVAEVGRPLHPRRDAR